MKKLLQDKSNFPSAGVWIGMFLCFVVSFGIVFVLYAGLPYDFTQDLVTHDAVLKRMSYVEIWGYAANPLTPAWFYMTEIGYLRPIYYLIVKIIFDIFGANFYPAHIIVAVGNGILNTIFFYLAVQITRQIRYGYLIVLLYNSFPTNASMTSIYITLDLQFFHSSLNIIIMIILAALTCGQIRKFNLRIAGIFFWIFLTWISIKWKSSEKLLPVIYFSFLSIWSNEILKKIGGKWLSVLILTSCLMFILVIPFKKLQKSSVDYGEVQSASFVNVCTKKDERMFSLNFENIVARLFYQKGQENPFTVLIPDAMPQSFTRSLGFFLGWFFWVSFFLSPWYLYRCRRCQV